MENTEITVTWGIEDVFDACERNCMKIPAYAAKRFLDETRRSFLDVVIQYGNEVLEESVRMTDFKKYIHPNEEKIKGELWRIRNSVVLRDSYSYTSTPFVEGSDQEKLLFFWGYEKFIDALAAKCDGASYKLYELDTIENLYEYTMNHYHDSPVARSIIDNAEK